MIEWVGRQRRNRGAKGFTLIELLVVIVILGILAAVVVFAVGGVGDKGDLAAAQIDNRTLQTAEETYCAKNGRYGTEAELVSAGLLSEQSSEHDIEMGSLGGCGKAAGTPMSSYQVFGPAEVANIAAGADQWSVSDTNSGPGYASSAFVYPLNSNTNDPLIIIGSDYTLQPGLATSWELIPATTNRAAFTSANPNSAIAKPLPAVHDTYTTPLADRPYNTDTWRFHLRPGVTFSDGSAFDADDLIWTWRDRMPLNPAPLNTVSDTLGFTHKRGGQTPDRWDSVEKIDQFTVDFTPKVQNLRLPEQIGHPKGAIVPMTGNAPFADIPGLSIPRTVGKHLDGSTGDLKAGTRVYNASDPANPSPTDPASTDIVVGSPSNPPVGTGPFKYVSYNPTVPQGGGTAEVTRNDAHWGTKAKVAGMKYTFIADATQRSSALLSGQFDFAIDLAATDVAPARSAGKRVVTAPFGQNALLYVNKVVKVTPATHSATFAGLGIPTNYTFNLATDPAVRRAVSLGLDRQTYVDTVYAGNAAPGRWMAPPNILGTFQNDVPAMVFSDSLARTTLDNAGWTCGGGAVGAGTPCAANEFRTHVSNGSPYDGRELRLGLIGSPDIPQAAYDLLVGQMKNIGVNLHTIRAACNATPCTGIARSQLYASSMWDLDLELPNQNDANPAFLPVLRMACNTVNNGSFRFAPVDSANSTGPSQDDVSANGNGTFPNGVNGCNMAAGVQVFSGLNTAANTTVNPLGPFELTHVPAARAATTQAAVQSAAAQQMRILVGQDETNVVIPLTGQFRIYGMSPRMSLGDPHPSNTSQRWTSLVKL